MVFRGRRFEQRFDALAVESGDEQRGWDGRSRDVDNGFV
jgi:hypothetical protein